MNLATPQKATKNYILLLIPTKLIILSKSHPHKYQPFLPNNYNRFYHYNIKKIPLIIKLYLRNVSFSLMQPERGEPVQKWKHIKNQHFRQ